MSPRPRPEVLQIHPYVGGESKAPGQNRTVKLSSNEGAFGVPPGAQAAVEALGADMHRYPDGGAAALREAIGAKFGPRPGADRLRCRLGRSHLYAVPRLWRPRHRADDEPAWLLDLRDRWAIRGLPDRQDGRAGAHGGCGCHAGGSIPGNTARIPGQSEQPDREHAACRRGGTAADRAAVARAAGAGCRLCRVCRSCGLRGRECGWSTPATTRS